MAIASLPQKKDGRYIIPKGFHVANDLVPLFQLKNTIVRSQLSSQAKKRLAWFDYYKNSGNVAKTCRYFGISRETFYLWWRRYDSHNLSTLEDRSRCPKNKRQRKVT